ncbi:MAG: bifunctional lysylphosphatidylglycerol flippase/synthetase MprF [Elusimicrobia bacterium]|nr:bifunctional lysylphosphatidylglycerol flippase/synthetase MprF [Elusimicrobiota bacterium]
MPRALERFRRIVPFLGLVFLGAALWFLHRFLAAHHPGDLWRELRAIPAARLAAAAALAALSYAILTLYDLLALAYVGRRLPYRAVAMTSFVSYAFSHNIGLSLLSGGSIRMRLYSARGLDALEIARMSAFVAAMFWSGYLLLAGWTWRPAGAVLLAIVAAFLAAAGLRRRPFRLGDWELPMPAASLAWRMVAVSVLDWCAAAAVLYALIPPRPQLTFGVFLSAFLLSQLAGLLSQVPGGVGVFEAGMLLTLGPFLPPAQAASILIAYRLVYYLLPFLLAVVLLGGYEAFARRKRAFQALGWLGRVVPAVAALAVFLAGSGMLFSGAVPSNPERLAWLGRVLPLGIIEFSHLAASVIGAVLLILAHGLWRRVSSAHALACLLLLAGAGASILKGSHWGQACVLAAVFGLLYASRREFFRQAALTREPFSAEWLFMIAAVLLCTLWLGLFSYKHVAYSNDLWWKFSLHGGGAPRFLRAGLAAAVTLLLFAAARLLRCVAPEVAPAAGEELDRVAPLVARCPRTCANLAFLGDKTFLWSRAGDAFLMYAAAGSTWVAMGEPVGPPAAWPELVWNFKDLCDRHGGYAAFYQVAPESLHVFADAGLSFLKLGEEAVINLERFSLEGSDFNTLRHAVNKLQNDDYRFEIVEPPAVAELLPQLQAVSDAWLAEKNTREKRFSIGRFDADYLRRFPAALVRRGGAVVAFANLWLGGDKEELSLDLMRHVPAAPNGIMDYLFARLMSWGREQGWRRFNLGLAPLAGLEARESSPLWNKAGGLLFRHGEYFYNFQGLRQYKEKFQPEWRARYLASSGGVALPAVLLDIASLVSGGLRGVLAK